MKTNHWFRMMKVCGLIISSFTASAATDTVGINKTHLIASQLKTGLNKYMVYYLNPATPKKITFWYWEREIKKREQNNNFVFEITQHWYGADTANYRYVRSVNSAESFAPILHMETIKGKTKAYKWSPGNIKGDSSIQKNDAVDFNLAFDSPNLNWNLDIETFEMLPLAKGRSFAINFYDAGLEPPKYVTYTVTDGEEINTLDGHKVDCWKLSTEGKMPNGKTYTETYWISKKNHEFLKEIDEFGGTYRYKIKMPDGAPNAAAIYSQN